MKGLSQSEPRTPTTKDESKRRKDRSNKEHTPWKDTPRKRDTVYECQNKPCEQILNSERNKDRHERFSCLHRPQEMHSKSGDNSFLVPSHSALQNPLIEVVGGQTQNAFGSLIA